MGLDLQYDAEGTSFRHRFSRVDWDTIEALKSHTLDDVSVCFDVPEFGESAKVSTTALRASAAALLGFLESNSQLLPWTYSYKLEWFPRGVPGGGFDTGGVSGLRLPGDPDHYYALHSGLDKCVLEKWAIAPDGAVVVETRDMRNERELITETAGRILFRKRKAKSSLLRALRDILKFLETIQSEKVTKTVG